MPKIYIHEEILSRQRETGIPGERPSSRLNLREMAFKTLRGDEATTEMVCLEKMRGPRAVGIWDKRSWERDRRSSL